MSDSIVRGVCDVHGTVVEWDFPGPPTFDGVVMSVFCPRLVVEPDPCIVGAQVTRECHNVLRAKAARA